MYRSHAVSHWLCTENEVNPGDWGKYFEAFQAEGTMVILDERY